MWSLIAYLTIATPNTQPVYKVERFSNEKLCEETIEKLRKLNKVYENPAIFICVKNSE
ncbi:hypothetical protein HMPREF1487_08971 [Pseudomonas sp. HPB0071]|uniref:Uncharacterized protein n=1 Tax=Pseudomonas luteola TaxID=47886 RepID=A0A2X2DD17_PSELU|nr:hypothetical protein HMPREF1487_08971 [Pseudomonas sp. HPB0071]SPZ16881.1 Uncharacterised protein [Pseudomonas luteola]SPZ16895.1 Uncharacterised protein [Pseudomonas luteola]